MTTYTGWSQVPDHLMTATALGGLEFPRAADGQPVAAWVETHDWRDRTTSLPLYDARTCPPTPASAARLAVAARNSKRRRVCADCGAHCQRPLPPLREVEGSGPLCPACRHIALLRQRQAQLARRRRSLAERAAQVLAWPGVVIVQVDLVVPPPTPSGRKRPATAAVVRGCDLDARRLVEVVVRLVGPRAQHVPPDAVPPLDAAPAILKAILGRRLIMWSAGDLLRLRLAAPHEELPHPYHVIQLAHLPIPDHVPAIAVQHAATEWRGQLDPTTRRLIESLAPGTPDRLLLLLHRMAEGTSR